MDVIHRLAMLRTAVPGWVFTTAVGMWHRSKRSRWVMTCSHWAWYRLTRENEIVHTLLGDDYQVLVKLWHYTDR